MGHVSGPRYGVSTVSSYQRSSVQLSADLAVYVRVVAQKSGDS